MQYFANDLSLIGQFSNLDSFRPAIARMMTIRKEILQYGGSLCCHRNLGNTIIFANMPMQRAIASLPVNERRVMMQWLTTHGPHWEDEQVHSSDDWYAINDNTDTVVTDTALAEAAAWIARGLSREVVSFESTRWQYTPIPIVIHTNLADQTINISNHWLLDTVRASLQANATAAIDSWTALASYSRRVYGRITFGSDAFRPLDGHPFVPGASERVQILLNLLNRMKGCFDDSGNRTTEGDYLYAQHFTGGKAWFTDSSDAEKSYFRNEMLFPHPRGSGHLFCTWHGKIKTPQYRIHFTFPIAHNNPLYVMYIGPKITKR